MAEQTRLSTEQDPSAIAHALASQALREEEGRRQSHRQKIAGTAKAKKDEETGKVLLEDGRRVTPMASYMQSAATDFTSIPDELVKRTPPYGKWHVRWVSKVDQFGQPSDTEIGYYQRFGYEVIYGKDGDPKQKFERRELVAMQGPPEGFAALLARSARPGSAMYESAFAELEDMVDSTNRRAGRRVVSLVTSDDHGTEPAGKVSF